MMDYSPKSETEVELVDGIQYDKGTLNANFITNQEKKSCEHTLRALQAATVVPILISSCSCPSSAT